MIIIKNKNITAISPIFTLIRLTAVIFLGVLQVSMATEAAKQQLISQIGSTTALM